SPFIDGYLDGTLTPEELTRLNAALKTNSEACRQLALATLLHDRMHDELRNYASIEAPRNLSAGAKRWRLPSKRWMMTAVGMAAALLVVALLWRVETVGSASAAVVALDRMIAAASEPVDRVYRIHVTDPGPEGALGEVLAPGKGRKPGVEGATLYVRGPNMFVLVRRFGDGSEFVTGSDGQIGWAVAPKGHVHLSHDTRRFRRGVPGEHEDIPFLDLSADFDALRRGYRLELTTDRGQGDAEGWSRLDAVKRSAKRPGAQKVHIEFDALGVAHRIELDGLPQDERGPRVVVFELIEQRDLGPEVYEHEHYHDADRPVDWE
ncbi:MAG TPA: hypothetical protein VHV77_00910, partial [Pirellulales bacterium]|nr:hypothetical protein [Pirellulales bacterium]